MPYSYEIEKPWLFTDDGQREFLKIRDRLRELTDLAGACSVYALLCKSSGESWKLLACIDRLIEIKEAQYLRTEGSFQNRILIRTCL